LSKAIGITDDREGTQYNISLTIFFISYALFEPLTNALLKRLTPRIFFTAIIIAWGTIMTLMGLVTSYKGLLVARFALGIAEAGLFPGRYISLTILLKTLTDCQRRHVLPFMLVQEL
jgi:MFS family permease